LADIARNSEVAEVVFHAWRLLGSDKVEPAWPTQPGDLQREADIRARIDELLRKQVRRTDERQRAADEVGAQGPVRWQRFAEAARDADMVASAARLREAFGVSDEQFGRLDPATRFNLSLYTARQSIAQDKAVLAAAAANAARPQGQGGDAALAAVVAELRKAAGDLREERSVADFARRVGDLDQKELFAERRLGNVFQLDVLGVVPVEFRRVEPKRAGERPFYLGTTEVSLAQFTAVVEAETAWGRVRSLVWTPDPGARGDSRKGPHTWEWTGSSAQAMKMIRAEYWLSPDGANSFPPEFRDPARQFNKNVIGPQVGGMPSDAHPVQHVSAEAAMLFAGLCGVRLPTAHEWAVAYEQFGKDVPAEKWNLRDKTFAQQRDYAAAARRDEAAQMPDAGIFPVARGVDGKPVASGAVARAGKQDDHTLYFRAVDSPELGGGSGNFRHLVGNVAELVCDAARPFERYNDRKTPDGIRKFATDNARALFVIGGSALSPPEAPFDQPQEVKPDAAYADVGFRLAFTAPSRNLAERLEWVLGDQDFVWRGAARQAQGAAVQQ
jgi:formylglycine-generating enzyme required for sulfatase activity